MVEDDKATNLSHTCIWLWMIMPITISFLCFCFKYSSRQKQEKKKKKKRRGRRFLQWTKKVHQVSAWLGTSGSDQHH